MPPVPVDSWAFLEVYFEGPLRGRVAEALDAADGLVTARDAVVETFNFIVRRTRRTELAWEWWQALAASPVRVVDVPLDDL